MSTRTKLTKCAEGKADTAQLTRAESRWLIKQLNELDGFRRAHDRRMQYAREILNQPPVDYDYLNHPG